VASRADATRPSLPHRYRGGMLLRRGPFLVGLATVLVAWSLGGAVAQVQRLATLELGFGDAVVAGAWNPLRLTLRDVGPVDLEIAIDAGSLREGEIPLVYRARIPGGSGLSVFDDELFVPPWRSLTWTVRAGTSLVASGSLPRAAVDMRAVDLVVTDAPGAWRARLGDGARVVDVPAERLLARSAAFDGVRTVVVSADGILPRVDVLVAAAVAGSVVLLSDGAAALPALAGLVPEGESSWRRVGSGWIALEAALERGPAVLTAARFDHAAALSAFAAADRLSPPASVRGSTVLFGAAAYVLAVLVVLRFGGLPGVVAAGTLAAAAGLLAWTSLRPEAPTFTATRDLVVGGGGIGQRWRIHEVMSLPAAEVRVAAASRPVSPGPLVTGPDGTTVSLARWRNQQLVERPRSLDAPLRWLDDDELRNVGARPLAEVQVKGGRHYGLVAPGAVALPPDRDLPPPSPIARALLDVVPYGTAIARDGATWIVALAEAPRALEELP
jgi:hypothetical protein